jgi:predicted SAM-dependent methyltransferase
MKLHIGGEQVKEPWKILNIQAKEGVDFIGDISDLSQFPDASIEEIYASHTLEHVHQKKMANTLSGIYRVLKQGGKFYISVPDLDILCHTFMSPLAPTDVKYQVMRMIFGGQEDSFDFHYFGWNQTFLYQYLQQAGFSGAERVDSFNLFNDSSNDRPFGFPISLNVIASK